MKYPFKYTFIKLGLAPGVSDQATVDIPKEYDNFTALSLSQLTLDSSNGVNVSAEALPLVLANIKPSTEDAGICNVASPLHSIAGNGSDPHLLDVGMQFEGNTSPVLTVKNLSADKTYDIYVTMHGYREKA